MPAVVVTSWQELKPYLLIDVPKGAINTPGRRSKGVWKAASFFFPPRGSIFSEGEEPEKEYYVLFSVSPGQLPRESEIPRATALRARFYLCYVFAH